MFLSKVFICCFALAASLLIYRVYRYFKKSNSDEIMDSILVDSDVNPFKMRIFICFKATDSRKGAKQALGIIKNAKNPKLIILGIVHVVSKEKKDGNILNLIKEEGYGHLASNIRITLSNSENLNECFFWKKAVEELFVDEPFCAFIEDSVIPPKLWDIYSMNLFEYHKAAEARPQKIILSSSPSGDFSVCAGAVHGIPYFESRRVTFSHDSIAIPVNSLFSKYLFSRSSIINNIISVVGSSGIPQWTNEAIISSLSYESNISMVTLTNFRLEQIELPKIPNREKFDKLRLNAMISGKFKESIGWDFNLDEPSGRARLGMSQEPTTLEKRLKWGDQNTQDHMANIAMGEY